MSDWTTRLYALLAATTVQLRKGSEFEGSPEMVAWAKRGDPDEPPPGGVLEIFAMPESASVHGLEKVDVTFLEIGVDKAKAEANRAELLDLLRAWPTPGELERGPSYMAVGGTIGDQGAAFQLFALGQVLGVWTLITPATLGITDPEMAREVAGNGFIMVTPPKLEA